MIFFIYLYIRGINKLCALKLLVFNGGIYTHLRRRFQSILNSLDHEILVYVIGYRTSHFYIHFLDGC